MIDFTQRFSNALYAAKKGWNMDTTKTKEIIDNHIAEVKANKELLSQSANAETVNVEKVNTDVDPVSNKLVKHDTDEDVAETEPVHVHHWRRGVLPGQKYIKQCYCGATEEIDYATWQNLG
jgi:hypothetical protein